MVPNSPAATALVPVMLFKNNPVFLNLSGGPAIAAMLLSAQHIREPRKGARARLYWFLFLAPIFWAILVLQTEWGGGIRAPLRFHPWLVIAALIPVGCIRGLVQRSRLRGLPGVTRCRLRSPLGPRYCL